MGKKDRKERKKKERQERIRRQKHERHSGPSIPLIYEEDLDVGPGGPEFELPPETATERLFWRRARGSSFLGKLRSLLPGGGPITGDREQAQELAYDALEAPSPGKATELARRALALDPECVDALNVLALNAARSRQEQIELLEQAVAAAERNLGGPLYFAENRGHFWGLLETRPYMRARAALADVLRGEGRLKEAIGHYEALLELNPNDNQGIRDVLLGCCFRADDREGVGRLLEQYEGDGSAIFAYGHVLERFLAGDREGAARARHEAHANNPHVEAYLTGQKHLPRYLPDYYVWGEETEAIHCAVYLLEAWERQAQAVAWLKSLPERPD
jgi:tetratricopeptide (TPR) repeat protein